MAGFGRKPTFKLRPYPEQGRLDIRTKTRAIAGSLGTPGSADLVREEGRGLRQDVDRLVAAADLARLLEELRSTEALVPVRAGASAPTAEQAHAILAAAGRLANGLQPPNAAAGQNPAAPAAAGSTPPDAAMTVMAALRALEQGRSPMGCHADAQCRPAGRVPGAQCRGSCHGQGRQQPVRGA